MTPPSTYDEPHVPAHPLRRIVRWLIIGLLTVGLARLLMLLVGA